MPRLATAKNSRKRTKEIRKVRGSIVSFPEVKLLGFYKLWQVNLEVQRRGKTSNEA
jgi:hypothetical protein